MIQMIKTFRVWLSMWLDANIENERGATMVEYGLIIALIALVVAGAAELLGGSVSALFGRVDTELDTHSFS